MNNDPSTGKNPLEIEADRERAELSGAFDDDRARTRLLDEYSATMQEQASVADVRQLKTVGDLLLRNLVVAADEIGDQRVLDVMGDVYKEIIPAATALSGSREPLPAEPMDALRKLQRRLNGSEGYTDTFPAMWRKPLIDSLMFANAATFDRAGGEIYRHHDKSYYIENIVGARLQLAPKF